LLSSVLSLIRGFESSVRKVQFLVYLSDQWKSAQIVVKLSETLHHMEKNRMSKTIKIVVLYLSKWVGLFGLARWLTRKGLRILCYHGVSLEDEHDFGRGYLFIREEVLRERLRFLARRKFPVLTLDEALEGLRKKELPAGATVITFDDGFYSQYHLARPLLEEFSFPATFYITTYYVAKQTPIFRLVVRYMFWKSKEKNIDLTQLPPFESGSLSLEDEKETDRKMWEFIDYAESHLEEEKRVELCKELGRRLGVDYGRLVESRKLSLMSEKEIREMAEAGFDIELHTHRHRCPLDEEEVKKEIDQNRKVLEPLTSKPLGHLCYPSGIWSPEHFSGLRSVGVKSATTCDAGLNYENTSLLALNRFLDGNPVHQIEFEAEMYGYLEILRKVRNFLSGKRSFSKNYDYPPRKTNIGGVDNRLSVVHVVGQLEIGGMEKLIVEFARHADQDRLQLRFVSLSNEGAVAEEIRQLGWEVAVLDGRDGLHLDLGFRLAKLLRQWKVDVVHAHNFRPLMYTTFASLLSRTPVLLYTRHGQNYYVNRRRAALVRLASYFTDRVICVSRDAQRVAAVQGVLEKKLCTISNGIDVSRFSYRGPNIGGPAVMVGRLGPEKDVETLLTAMATVVKEEPDFCLEVVGDGECLSQLKNIASQLGLNGKVKFLGHVDDIAGLLSRASLFVLPSVTEGISLAALEAMASGLPVVLTRVGGNVEIVDEAQTGLLVSKKSPDELACAIMKLLRDPARAKQMGLAARAKVEQQFDVRRMVREYEKLYFELTGRSIPEGISIPNADAVVSKGIK